MEPLKEHNVCSDSHPGMIKAIIEVIHPVQNLQYCVSGVVPTLLSSLSWLDYPTDLNGACTVMPMEITFMDMENKH
jgi:hypothetical protein